MIAMDNSLTVIEATDLSRCEQVIERGLNTFYEVGNALMEIRSKRLYRATHGTFEDYCNERWSIGRKYANYMIAASEVVDNLGTIVPKPETESQARPLASLPPAQQVQAWQTAISSSNGKPTAAHVQAAVNEIKQQSQPVESPIIDPKSDLVSNMVSVPYTGDTEPMEALRESLAEVLDEEESEGEVKTTGRQKPKLNRAGNEYVAQGFDACQTPAYAVTPLLPYLNPGWRIWEPAVGEGLLRQALIAGGIRDVLGSDILTGENFFEYEPVQWDVMVTNPPYSIKYRWLKRCYALGKPFALLIPVETLGAKTAQSFFRQKGIEVILMDQRINFKMPSIGFEGSAAQFPTAWFCYGLNIGQQLTFAEIERGK